LEAFDKCHCDYFFTRGTDAFICADIAGHGRSIAESAAHAAA
jgi:hypothetical protein